MMQEGEVQVVMMEEHVEEVVIELNETVKSQNSSSTNNALLVLPLVS
jgi:hypothetical protein